MGSSRTTARPGTPSGGSFSQVLLAPGVARTALPYGLARVGVTMELLALLLFVHDRTGSFMQAGLVNACFAAGAAVVAPLLGRAVDRNGQARVLVPCALAHASALLVVVAAAGSVQGVVLGAAVLAGASMPPLSSCMRVLWPRLVPERLRGTAYSVESLLVEVAELAGPATVGGLVLLVSPGAALLGAAGLVAGGALVFASSGPSRTWRTKRSAARPLGLLVSAGPLRTPGVRMLTLVVLLSTAGFSALEVSIARFASDTHHPGMTGLLLMVMVTGSLIGAWGYGRRPRTSPLPDQLVLLMALGALLGLTPLLARDIATMALAMLLTGVLIAPATSVQFLLMTEVAPEDSRTEAFTWASTASFLGVGGGTALAGTAVSAGGSRLGLLLAGALSLVSVLVALRTRSVLRPRRTAPRTVTPEEHAEVVRERDEALAALRVYGERCDAMARELARLRQDPVLGPVAAVAPQQRGHLRAVADPPPGPDDDPDDGPATTAPAASRPPAAPRAPQQRTYPARRRRRGRA